MLPSYTVVPSRAIRPPRISGVNGGGHRHLTAAGLREAVFDRGDPIGRQRLRGGDLCLDDTQMVEQPDAIRAHHSGSSTSRSRSASRVRSFATGGVTAPRWLSSASDDRSLARRRNGWVQQHPAQRVVALDEVGELDEVRLDLTEISVLHTDIEECAGVPRSRHTVRHRVRVAALAKLRLEPTRATVGSSSLASPSVGVTQSGFQLLRLVTSGL